MVTAKTEGETIRQQKRIASNTLVLFLRVFVITIVNLYSVRIILNGLGTQDYGIYNAIAGFVLTCTCFIPVFSLSLQRFYSYAIGKHDEKQLQDIFSASTNIIILFLLAIFILFETLGIWFMNTHMTIPADRTVAANWIFQFALFSFLFTIMQIPFSASMFAHEEMGFYAIFSFVDCLLKLLTAILIGSFFIDNLIFYGSGILVTSIIVFCLYAITSRSRYRECRYKTVTDHSIYKKLLSFSGWTLYSSLAGVGLIQGSTILLNIFFGPITNAAFAIANNFYNAFNSLANSIVLAFRPPMIQSYATDNFNTLDKLFFLNNKFILYLLTIVAIPIIAEMDTILKWWLGTATEESILFSRLFIIYTVCLIMHHPITTIIQASSRIKEYYLLTDTLNIMHLPIAWLLFHTGMPSQWIFYTMITVCIASYILRIVCLRRIYNHFSCKIYIKSLLLPGSAIIVISAFAAYLIHCNVTSGMTIRFLSVFSISPVITLSLICFIGTTASEKSVILNYIKNKRRK